MKIDFLSVLITVATLMVIAVPGFLLVKSKMLRKNACDALSTLVLYGCQPFLMFMGFQKTRFDSQIGLNMLYVALLSAGIHLVMIGVAYLVFRGKSADIRTKVARYGSVFGNCGYMGLPFLQTLFQGNDALMGEVLIYASVVIAVFNFICWTFGVYMITGDVKEISPKKIFLNPTIIGILIGFVVFVAVKVPLRDVAPEGSTGDMILTKLLGSFDFLGDMVTPLAMIVIGMRLAFVKPKQLFLDAKAYVVCLLKLVVMSVISMLAVAFLPVGTVVKYVVFFLLSMPCATNTALFAIKYGGDGDSAAVYVMLSAVISVVTIPLMFLAFSGIFGIII